MNTATHLILPSASIYNLWENLYYDSNIKENVRKQTDLINFLLLGFSVVEICTNNDGIF